MEAVYTIAGGKVGYKKSRIAASPSAGVTGCLTPSQAGWDNPTMIVTMDAKRRLTVPASLAQAAPGDYFDARFDPEEHAIIFRRLPTRGDWLAILAECPVSMDDLPARRQEPARRRKL